MRRRLFSVPRIPRTIPEDVRRSIQRDLWRSARRSPLFWIIATAEGLFLIAIELPLLWWTPLGTIAHEVLPYFAIVLVLPLALVNANLFFEKDRVAAWLSHGICPECGYDLTGNTSGIC